MRDVEAVYKEILKGHCSRFPPFTWDKDHGGFKNFKIALRYLILDELGWDRTKCVKTFSHRIISEYKLQGATVILFNNSVYHALNFAFPEWEIKPWELNNTPNSYWTRSTFAESMKWLIEERLKLSPDNPLEIFKSVGYHQLKDYGITGQYQLNLNSIVDCLEVAYPDMPWRDFYDRKKTATDRKQDYNILNHFKSYLKGAEEPFPKYIWKQPHSKEDLNKCIRYLILEHLGMNREMYTQEVKYLFFLPYGLYNAMNIIYAGSVYKMTCETFPEWEIKPWELLSTPTGFWKDEKNIDIAFRWLLEETLCWTPQEALTKLNKEVAKRYGLQTAYIKTKGRKDIVERLYGNLEACSR